jgi:hypothetical protein
MRRILTRFTQVLGLLAALAVALWLATWLIKNF